MRTKGAPLIPEQRINVKASRMRFASKVRRLRNGGTPRVLDLFAGCGGISLGFHSMGFQSVAAVELDPNAARSYALNLHRDADPDDKLQLSRSRNIVDVEPRGLLRDWGYKGDPAEAVDVIVGGPPCQAFARVGRAKLREVASHPEAYLKDPRGDLYLRLLHYVKQLKPVALLMENVPDVLNYGGHNIADEMCEVLSGLGYVCRYTFLNAVYYGVPEMRERVFLLAYAGELDALPTFPSPTHHIDLPRGYESSRQVAMQAVPQDLFAEHAYFTPSPTSDPRRSKPAVTAEDALSDLPPITLHLEGKLTRGARRFDEAIPYPRNGRLSEYAKLMRTWPSFTAPEDGIRDHVIRYLPRDYPIFRRMNPGDQYPEAHQHAVEMFEETLARRTNGHSIRPGSVEYKKLFGDIVPPYDAGKFPNKWRKMERDKPARTLMAHLGKDGYSHIHYDSKQARTISVREAARLQSFPDGFVFDGTMNPAFRQIGNAVPPLVAKAIAAKVMGVLKGTKQ